ncbi:MAG: carboxypeptidase T [Arenicella sp.]
MIKKLTSLIALLLLAQISTAQLSWSRVKIFGTDSELQQLGTLGLPVDHGEYKKNTHFMTDISSEDIALLDQHGFTYEIVIQDVKQHYKDQSYAPVTKDDRAACPTAGGAAYNPTTPANWNQGTMGGYLKYQEFLDELDDMRTMYPTLITAKDTIDNYVTIDGNPVYYLRISDNADTDEAEKEVLYTSIHHAREPNSLMQTIFYMWYILENYGTDPEVTFLVDNTEMYFVPMINPDGYRYNELTDPTGGGMHRKNRNLVSGGTSNPGVDLNRNYAYHWDESGTSNNPNNDTWPGTADFTEVETQAIKWLCEDREFEFAFNAHSHGNLLLYPMGWSDVAVAPHEDYFAAYGDHMVIHNGYTNMKSSGLYPAAGDSDDWMYIDDLLTKDTIFAMTPEVSSYGSGNEFWPPASAIEGICKANVHMNMTLSHMPHVFGVTTDLDPSTVATTTGSFNYELERLGRTDGDITVSMTPIAGIQSFGAGNVHTLDIMEIVQGAITYTLLPGVVFGDDITFLLETDNGSWTRKDTIYKSFGLGTVVFTDDATNLDNWTGDWSFTNEEFVSPNNCITDSPFSDYSNNTESDCELIQSLSLVNATYGYVNFWAQWEIENDWDYCQFMISIDGGSAWIPLCGKYTNQGGANQDFDNPLYDNFQTDWVFEEIDLDDYLGESDVRFKFHFIADGGVTEEGFYFDDFSLSTDADESTESITEIADLDVLIYPNPTSSQITIAIEQIGEVAELEITNNLGQVISTQVPNGTNTKISTSNLAEGVYFVNIITNDGEKVTKRFTVIR